MRMVLSISLAALINFGAYAEIYKTTDKQGRVVYTDQPAASDTKAKVVELPTINQVPPTDIEPVQDNAPRPAAGISYKLDIISPTTGARLMANQRTLDIAVNSDTSLQQGHFFTYFLNGEKIAQSTQMTFTVNEPPRGENKIHVTVQNQYGKVFGQSDTVTVYVMRPIIKH